MVRRSQIRTCDLLLWKPTLKHNPFYASVSKGAASTTFYTFGMVHRRYPGDATYQISRFLEM